MKLKLDVEIDIDETSLKDMGISIQDYMNNLYIVPYGDNGGVVIYNTIDMEHPRNCTMTNPVINRTDWM